MTKASLPPLLIIANSDALINLCGISLLERWRRVAINIGFSEATILAKSVTSITAHITAQSWHGEDVQLKFQEWSGAGVSIGDVQSALAATKISSKERVLVVFANFYCDGRLLHAMVRAQSDAALVDLNPPSITEPFWENFDLHSFGRGPGAALLSREWLSEKNREHMLKQELVSDLMAGRIALVDAAREPTYIPGMRRNVRPIFFPAPSPQHRLLAERLLRDATQKGVLDFPARVHAPIEKWIVSHLGRTSITPNQVTLATGFIGLCVTILYASGNLWVGALLALAVGILDGVDGKLARLKIQMTKAGKGEHVLDYLVELSWWMALAYHFHVTGQMPYAYGIWSAFFAFDVLERIAKWSVERRKGRSLDDVSRFDRAMRYVAGRRNIYTWLFSFCLILGAPATGFICLCGWGIVSAAIHLFRALQIRCTSPEVATINS